MSNPSRERLSILPAEGSPRTLFDGAAPECERGLQSANIPMSRLDQQGRRSSAPASATSSPDGRASDSTDDSTTVSTPPQRPEGGEPLDVLNENAIARESVVPPRRYFKRCLAWMDSNKMITLIGILALSLSAGALYTTVVSYRIADNTYRLERWRDCQDRLVRTTYNSTVR